MVDHPKLVRMRIVNIGCIGPEGLSISLDKVLCIVGTNNTGKSTILRAYELAHSPSLFNKEKDLCCRGAATFASIELEVHIPEGTPNISEEWKTSEGDLLLVKSKWEWNADNSWIVNRQTWNPAIEDYSPDSKASGLDTVFQSRLPKPFRIGTLEDPEQEHKRLLTLILQPVADKLKTLITDGDSELNKAIAQVTGLAQAPVDDEQGKLNELKDELTKSHNEIFPNLEIDLSIGIGEISINPLKQLMDYSHIRFREWETNVDWKLQGTGSQRALFWTMLQARSKLNALSDISAQKEKDITDRQNQILKLTREIGIRKKEGTKAKKRAQIKQLEEEIIEFKRKEPEVILKEQESDLSLPSFMLLIDEPEVGLHPGAIRAASRYLYGLAEDPAWQVMITTHSPLFIDPLQDHTTIIRLDTRV